MIKKCNTFWFLVVVLLKKVCMIDVTKLQKDSKKREGNG